MEYTEAPFLRLFKSLSVWQMTLAGVLTFLLMKLINGGIRFWRFHKYFSAMPGEIDFHWIYGNYHKITRLDGEERRAYLANLTARYSRFRRIFRTPFQASITCIHYDTVKKILRTSEPKPRGVMTLYVLGIDWLGEGLLISNGPKWARNRKLLTPAFHFDILQPYINVKNEAADILLDKIESCIKADKSFELFEYMGLYTLDVLLRCAFSYNGDIQKLGENHPYIKAVSDLGLAWVHRAERLYLHPNWIYYMTSEGKQFAKDCKFVHDFAENIIMKRKRELEDSTCNGYDKRKYLDFLDILLKARDENNDGLSLQDIRNEADTFLFEGHDTTTSALSWILYTLATHPEHQKKVQEEINEIYAGKDSEYISADDFPKMEYLTKCMKEGLRLYNPVPVIQRQLTKPLDIDGFTIPAGTTITVSISSLHHNPAVWENPEEFRPERFSPENVKRRDSFAYVPFSAGPRNCIGQNFAMHEMKVVLTRILHKYTLEVDPSVPVLRKLSVVTKSENGIHMFARPRN